MFLSECNFLTVEQQCFKVFISQNSGKPVGESSQFRGPKPQDLVAFRRMLEQGKLEIAKSTVWGNPRYLISSGDTPTILQVYSK